MDQAPCLRCYRCDILGSLVVSSRVVGFPVGLLPQNPGRLVDDWMFWLADGLSSTFSFPESRSAGVLTFYRPYCRTVMDFVALD